ncbi:MipA/OmpV family protein [Pseudoalteromonas sp. S2755]|uniref:MipA/OmpV family protein n=1 Tax=Pseudoalteromonas sp. S2755 TaxID=2066523 RepID=UPI00110AFB26|nr:MipA/OmpV family protein [Pseudoalteromonas sp. S2755]TMN38639.1 MipA/OmpV family protein [Pseudoalteromonas sp. S2755]
MKKLLIIISLLLPFYGICEEHSDELDDEFAWQLSVGAFYVDMTMPALIGTDSTFKHGTFLVDAKIEYKSFYLNTHSGDFFGGSDVGYQIINNGEWGIDAIYGSYMLPFSERGYYDTDDVVPELRGIRKRDQDNSLGFSYYRHVGEFLAVAEIVYDVFGDTNGWVFHLEATRNFELRNWDLWLNFGANYYSSNFHNYFYGVSEDEANGYLTPYKPGASASAFVQMQLNYPIAEDWVFSAGASWLVGSQDTLDSPLVRSRHARVFFTGVKYVF